MAAVMARPLLAALALLSLVAPAAAVEVCKVVDLQLVTQTGEFFLAGANTLLYYPRHLALPWPLKARTACGLAVHAGRLRGVQRRP